MFKEKMALAEFRIDLRRFALNWGLGFNQKGSFLIQDE